MNNSELLVRHTPAEPLEAAGDVRGDIERMRAGFVNTLVRDVRLPLTSVLGLLDLFQSKLAAREPFDMEDRRLLSVAVEHGSRMRRLVDDLLEAAQQHERPLALEPARVDAAELIEDACEGVRADAALRGVAIRERIDDDTPPLLVDRHQACRALRHLVCVALEATRAGAAVTVEAQGLTGTRAGDAGRSFVLLSVADEGDGIPPEELPFVFDTFWQSTDPRRNSARRSVSLALAKRVAAAHGGSVSVRSRAGTGTTYSVVLPADAASEEADGPRRRVLVVDDAPDLLLLVGKLVERMGYEAVTALDVPRALEALAAREIDLVLTDWAMPELGGGELIARMKQDARWRTIPVVVLTGHDMERRHAQEVGCDRFLVKPVAHGELQRVLSELLAVGVS